MEEIMRFLVSVAAGIIANCISKWFGGYDERR